MPAERGVVYDSCRRCHGVFVEADDLVTVFGGPLPAPEALELPNPFAARLSDAGDALVCPVCQTPTLTRGAIGELDHGVFGCEACGGMYLELSAFVAARQIVTDGERAPRISTRGLELETVLPRNSMPATPSSQVGGVALMRDVASGSLTPPAHPEPREVSPPALTRAEAQSLLGDDGTLGTARLAHDEPWSQLITIPASILLAWLLLLTPFGRLLSVPISIQFHEAGHAFAAWLSGRIAVPLPCGMTFWSEAPSIPARVLLLALLALLAVRSARERRFFGLVAAISIAIVNVTLAMVVDDRTSLEFVIASGCAGELVLSASVLTAFYFRMPDAVRWDFFRFLMVPFAAIAFVASMRLWVSVLLGSESAPVGSIMGTPGDGTGDLDRLMHDYGVSLDGLVRGYVTLGFALSALVLVVYTLFAANAARRLADAG